MVLSVKKDSSLDNDYIDIKYRELNPTINSIIELCGMKSGWLIGECDEKTYNIDINEVLYIEWVDTRCCICTSDKVYTASTSLARMEELLSANYFVRVNKAFLVNVFKVRWVSSGLNTKLITELVNGERITISRHYRGDLLNAIYAIAKEVKK